MAGPAVTIEYISGPGTHYNVLVPSWQQTFTTDATPATATAGAPKGFRRRRRYLRDVATGKEIRVTVGDVTKAAWTSAYNAVPTAQPVVPGHTGVTYHYAGYTDEKYTKRG